MPIVYTLIMWSWVAADPARGSYVDVIGFENPAGEQLLTKYPDEARIPPTEALLPERYRKIAAWTVVTAAGVGERKVTGLSLRRGAGEDHLIFWLDGPPIADGLAVNQALPKAGPLRPVRRRSLAPAATRRLMQDVLAALDPDARKSLQRKSPRAKDIETVSLKLKGVARLLVFVHIPEDEAPATYRGDALSVAGVPCVTRPTPSATTTPSRWGWRPA